MKEVCFIEFNFKDFGFNVLRGKFEEEKLCYTNGYNVTLFISNCDYWSGSYNTSIRLDNIILESYERDFDFFFDLHDFIFENFKCCNDILLTEKEGVVCGDTFYIMVEKL